MGDKLKWEQVSIGVEAGEGVGARPREYRRAYGRGRASSPTRARVFGRSAACGYARQGVCTMAGRSVLVVDDDPLMLRLIGHRLQSAGYEVLIARDGQEALDVLRRQVVPLLITDWSMPQMSGLDLVRAIRANDQWGTVHVIMLTGQSEVQHVVQALNAGADDFVRKPFEAEELLARLRAGERIIELNRIESERNRLREAVSAMEQVLAVVAHELRTPLAGMRATAELVLDADAPITAESLGLLGQMHQQILRMSDLIENLLDAARTNCGLVRWNWETVALEAVAQEALDTVRPLVASDRVRIECTCAPRDLAMRGDADALRRLIVNLLSNAARNTQAGRVELRIARAEVSDGGQWISLGVSDTGSGIAPDILARLGEAFALSRGVPGGRSAQGSGLGLAICRGIAAAHGGRMEVRSTPGKGTTVNVLLRADSSGPVQQSNSVPLIKRMCA